LSSPSAPAPTVGRSGQVDDDDPTTTTATVYEIEATSVGFLSVPFVDWPVDPTFDIACASNWCVVWLFANGGEVTEILEQHVL